MARQPKSNLTDYQNTWSTLTPWAQSQGISTPDIETVAQMDYNRILQGSQYPMSKDEAMSALLSLKKGSPITTTPGAAPVSFFHNPLESISNNVQGIVSGIFHLPETLFDQGKEAIEHPSTIWNAIDPELAGNGSIEHRLALRGQAIAHAPILDLLPFVADVGDLMSSQGRAYLSDNPVTAALDLGGVGKIADLAESAARTAGFDSAADLLSKFPDHPITNALKTAWARIPKYAQNAGETGIQAGLARTAYSFQDYVNEFLQHFGLNKLQRERILRVSNTARAKLTAGAAKLEEEAAAAQKVLSPEERQLFTQLTQGDAGYDWSTPTSRQAALAQIAEDDNIPIPVRRALEVAVKMEDKYESDALGHPTEGRVTVTHHGVGTFAENPKENALQEAYLKTYTHPTTGDTENIPIDHPIWKRTDAYEQAKQAELAAKTNVAQIAHAMDNMPSAWKFVLQKDYAAAMKDARTAERDSLKALKKVDNSWKTVSAARYGYVYHDQFWSKAAERAEQVQPDAFNERVAARIARKQDELDKLLAKHDDDGNLKPADLGRVEKLRAKIAEEQMIRPLEDDDVPMLVDHVLAENRASDPLVAEFIRQEGTKIRNEVLSEVQRMRAAGSKPMMVPRVDEQDIGTLSRPGMDVSRPYKPQVAFSKALTPDSSTADTMIGLKAAHVQILRRDVQREMLPFFDSMTKTTEELKQEALLDFRARNGRAPNLAEVPGVIDRYRSAKYKEWDPTSFADVPARKSVYNRENAVRYIRKSDLNLATKVRGDLDKTLSGAYNKAMGLFRFSILGLSPRYFAHITLGGSFFLAVETGPMALRFFKPALEMVRGGDFPDPMSIGVNEADLEGRANSLEAQYARASGKTMGRMKGDGWLSRHSGISKVIGYHESYMEFLEHVSNMQRALAYFYGTSYAARKGADTLLSEDEKADAARYGIKPEEYYGVKVANRVLSDMKAHTPIERAITRWAIPFYGWTRHVVRFTLKFPFDHPLRAAVISNLSAVALEQDQNLPEYYYRLFFLGQPNQLGDVQVVDYRQWNPLRDVANYMTLAGIVQALNPAIQGVLASAGVGQNGSAGELYPTLDYSSFYGSQQVSHQEGLIGPFEQEVSAFIPQSGAVENYFNANSQLRYDKKFNPGKFAYDLADQIAQVPWVPYTLNLKQMTAREEIDQYDEAAQAAQLALSNNQPSDLNGYGPLVPLSGWNVSPSYIAALIRGDTSGLPEESVLAMRYAPRAGFAELLGPQGNEQVLG